MTNNLDKLDALTIIDRFGGIRPMAKKLDVAVTTVQGWKKREAIPASRMESIYKAAKAHNVDLSVEGPKNAEQNTPIVTQVSKSSDTPKSEDIKASKPSSSEIHKSAAAEQSTHEIQYIESKGLSGRTVFMFMIVLVVFMVAGLMTIAPKVKVVTEQADRITSLERELRDVKQEQDVLTSVVPNDLKNKLKMIEQKAQSATTKAQQVASKAKGFTETLTSGSVDERLGLIENQLGSYIEEKTSMDLFGVWKNLQALRDSEDGTSQLGETSKDLLSWINRLQSDEVTVEEALPIIVEESPLIGKTLGGVEKENLKAAAMLLAMSQLRDSLSRDNQSFEQDLQLMKKLVGDENPALVASINSLAPHAQNGVLTPSGLSDEFRELAGEVVVASLSGEDVSISEKAKSRFGEILVIEKNGEQITGTETQRAVADAQRLIDSGDIQGTIQVLQNLDGDAASAVQPFLQEAKLSLLASQVQELLGQNIQSKLRISSLTSGSNIEAIKSIKLDELGVENVLDNIKEAVPLGGKVYEDPESGFKIYKQGTITQ